MVTFVYVVLISVMFHPVLSIMGGWAVRIEEVPYHVSYGDECGGALVGKIWVVTTAHCRKEHYIRVGSDHYEVGRKVKIRNHMVHPRFRENHEFDFDVQLLRLVRPLKFTKKVQPIKLMETREDGIIMSVLVTGWGYPKEKGDFQETLQQVILKTIPLEECQKVDKSEYNHTLTSRMFCTGIDHGRDACQGDSGGGAVSERRLVGLSSFGFGCGRVPGVYTDLTHTDIHTWLHTNIRVYTYFAVFTVLCLAF